MPSSDQSTTAYTYDGDRNARTITRTEIGGLTALTTEYTYDPVGRLKEVIQHLPNAVPPNPSQLKTTFVHDSRDYAHRGQTNLDSVTDAKQLTTIHKYDEIGRLIETIDPEHSPDAVTKYTYYPNDLLKTVRITTADNVGVTTYVYNELGQVKEIVYPDESSSHKYTYDGLGNLRTETTRKGDLITYEYDALNRRTKKIYPNGDEIVFHYKANGLLEQVDDLVGPGGIGGSYFYDYDLANRLTSVTDPWGHVVGYHYDKNGNRDEITYPNDTSVTLKYQYDALNRLDWIDDQAIMGQEDYDFVYDAFDRRKELIYPNGVVADYDFDDAHRLTEIINTSPAYTQPISKYLYTPDPVGNREDRTTLDGMDDYTYDDIHRLKEVTYADGRTVTYELDAVGNRKSVTDNGVITNYIANNLNQYTSVGGQTYTYDPAGCLTDDGARTFDYDYDNRLIEATNGSTTVYHTYDFAGRRVSTSVLAGSYTVDQNSTPGQWVYLGTFAFADDGTEYVRLTPSKDGITTTSADAVRWVSVDDPSLEVIVDNDDAAGYTEEGTWFDSGAIDMHGVTSRYTGTAGDSATWTPSLPQPGQYHVYVWWAAQISSTTYYDRDPAAKYEVNHNGLPAQAHDVDQNSTSGQWVRLGRFTFADDGTEYVRLIPSKDGTHTTSADAVRWVSVDNPNLEVIVDNDDATGYTEAGTWFDSGAIDMHGATSRYTGVLGDSATWTPTSLHGPGQYDVYVWWAAQISSTTYYDRDPAAVYEISHNALATHFVYDGDEVIADVDGSGTITKRYVYGPGIDEVLSLKTPTDDYYLTRDGINSVTDVTDSNGAVVEQYKYDVYGQPTILDGTGTVIATSGVGNRYLFTGREWEAELSEGTPGAGGGGSGGGGNSGGLYYYRARHYDPQLGRFLQPDPLGYIDGFNLYEYVLSNPTNNVDITGNEAITATAAGSLTAAGGTSIGMRRLLA